ncbi:hypothetical protein ACWT_3164 [Actinoplanes sp. SE50]|uniref:hypothetical protein n=1 Tax=unclassified Actinoplanes TaxID=2626549 RepID=UPI00023EC60A|nr:MULTISPECIES: hypothetical protein [unclassified Actinoplanes]AEV84187.1 hypothetical protein ACPL_3292 [Actinoplanes sp. SE50/110]ATO82579.1 hypothetical protein ACWT_3164 [Actinoplanes sp. SE50]SLL99986.1 hypothetical protein ACSP50_3218 [Actinoplanes sp. SE50/110]
MPRGTTSLGWGPQGLGLGYPAGAAILTSLLITVVLAVLAGFMAWAAVRNRPRAVAV